MADPSVTLEAVYDDTDLVELAVTAENESFRGRASVYLGVDELAECISNLAGFPTSVQDRRKFEWGSLAPDQPLGGAGFEFSCVDAAGHAAAWVRLKSADTDPGPPEQTVNLFLRFEPANLDRFIDELRVVNEKKRGMARLLGRPTRG